MIPKSLFAFTLATLMSTTAASAQGIWRRTNDDVFGLHIGYVSKQWSTDFGSHKYHEDLFGEEDCRLHGLQIGITYMPVTQFHVGAYTGLFSELYFASGSSMGYDRFTEFSAYIPLHAAYSLPLSHEASITLHGGLGLNCALHGEFYDDDEFYYDRYGERYRYEGGHLSLHYGHDGWPRRLNASLELAAQVRIKSVLINATYSWGLTDHNLYNDHPHPETTQNKIGISVGWSFNDE